MSTTLASIDLADAPVGWIFDSRQPDSSVEERYFSGWRLPLTPHKYWKRPSPFIIDREDDGTTVLECLHARDAAMVAGDRDWQDYTVSARVRLISEHAPADEDLPTNTDARAGVMARYLTSRHFYYLCLVSRGAVALFRRADAEWRLLAQAPVDLDSREYYDLSLQVVGDSIRGSLGDVVTLIVRDDTYTSGPGGIRVNARARFDGVCVTAAASEPETIAARRETRLSGERRLQSGHPQERLVAAYPKPEWPHEYASFCRIAPGGEWGFLLYNSAQIFSAAFASTYSSDAPMRVGVADLHGNLLWGRDVDVRFPKAFDADGDGRDEIVGIANGCIVVLDPDTGDTIAETPLPATCPFQGPRDGVIDPDLYPWYPADLRGTGTPSDLLVKDDMDSHGGRTFWAYTGDLQMLWTARVGFPRYGHTLAAADINGDGRDEVLAGFHCYDADGALLWKCLDAELSDDDHVDEVKLGLFGPNGEPRACGTNGADGFHLLDGTNGDVIACYNFGHAQGVSVGNYLPDRPGMEYCVGSRWGSFGILNVVDAYGAVVATWEPDNVSQGGPPVTWTDSGQQFIFLSSSEEAFGLWDGHGNRCVRLECPELPYRGFYGVQKGQGAALDIDGDGLDELVFTFPNATYVYKADI